MVCQLPVDHNYSNYKNDADHDNNTRKFWFLVFGRGLYTKKTDADAAAENDNGVHIFNTRAQATRAWARHCRRRHSKGCHETKDPVAHASDADTNTDKDTKEPRARARVLDRAARQRATGKRSKKGDEGVKREIKEESLHHARQASTARAASVPVKRAPKAEPASPKKLLLYVDTEDSDEDLFKSDSSAEVPLTSLAPSRAQSRATSALSSLPASRAQSRATSALSSLPASRAKSRAPSALSGLEEDEDVPMPPPDLVVPVSPTISSVSSLTTTASTGASNFSSISGALRASAPPAAGPSTPHVAVPIATPPGYMFFNRRTRVLYDDPKAAIEEKKPGKSMQMVDTGEIVSLIGGVATSANLLYNRKTQILYDDLKVAIEERKAGESMQVVDPAAVLPWISALGR
ncbi:hypothetical protein K438DRAFT_1991518 [Mycena galopus ATCC 62051]|nr:hypothetical protein K438DRAFT_1991518 [Mycena galopus ATCC 62051]